MTYYEMMSAFERMEFDYEYNRYLDIDEDSGQWWVINAELQILAEEMLG